jgi:hypothetical protein
MSMRYYIKYIIFLTAKLNSIINLIIKIIKLSLTSINLF